MVKVEDDDCEDDGKGRDGHGDRQVDAWSGAEPV